MCPAVLPPWSACCNISEQIYSLVVNFALYVLLLIWQAIIPKLLKLLNMVLLLSTVVLLRPTSKQLPLSRVSRWRLLTDNRIPVVIIALGTLTPLPTLGRLHTATMALKSLPNLLLRIRHMETLRLLQSKLFSGWDWCPQTHCMRSVE